LLHTGRTGPRIQTVFAYDASGHTLAVPDPNNVGQDTVYDALGRSGLVTDTIGHTTNSTYDKSGNKIAAIDGKGNSTSYTFDARGRQTAITDRLGGSTLFTYLKTGQLESLKDAENQVTSYTFDTAGNKLTEEYPDHIAGSSPGNAGYGTVTFTYDPVGRATLKQDQLGDTCTYNHDLAGRLSSRDYRTAANSSAGAIADTDSFTYDRASRMLTAVSGR
jgi:YD repeat-containing protein